MTPTPKYSILIANYNNRAYASELLDSMLAQGIDAWEAIIVDDASPDGGIADIVEAKHDPRFIYIPLEQNAGAAHAWNLGFTRSRGDFFPIIGADDKFHARYLETVDKAFAADPELDIVYVDLELFGSVHRVASMPQKSLAALTVEQWLPHPGACVTRGLMERSGGYYEGPELRHGNIDWDFWLSCVEKKAPKMLHIAEPLCYYRQHNSNMSKKRCFFEHVIRQCLYDRHKAFFDTHGDGTAFVHEGFIRSAAAYWKKGDYTQAVELAKQAMALHPLTPPQLCVNMGNIAKAAQTAVLLEQHFQSLQEEAYAPTSKNYEDRVVLSNAYLALHQWPQAEESLCMGFGMACGHGQYDLACWFANRLALLYGEPGKDEEVAQAIELGSICSPYDLENLHLRWQAALAAGKRNLALQLFSPWLNVQDDGALQYAAPYFGLLADLDAAGPAWAGQRLTELKARGVAPIQAEVMPRIYTVPLGRRMVWEYRARDLYQKYGQNEGGYGALRQAVAYTKARNVLEIGCGNGRNLNLFAQLGLQCVGQEISGTALSLAKERNLPNTTLHLCPISELDYPDKSFDLVVSNRVLQLLTAEDAVVALKEMARMGRYIYLNELAITDDVQEQWYEKKHDYTAILAQFGMKLLTQFTDVQVPNAMVFGTEEHETHC